MGAAPEHRAATLEGQVARVADIIAYVNHDVDDAVRAGLLQEEDLPSALTTLLGTSPSQRIGRMVTDVVEQTLSRGLHEIRMSEEILRATLDLRAFLFEAVYENPIAMREFKKTEGILRGLWARIRERADEFLDHRTLEAEGLDAAAQDFLAGMTDRFAVQLFEELYIPKPWVE